MFLTYCNGTFVIFSQGWDVMNKNIAKNFNKWSFDHFSITVISSFFGIRKSDDRFKKVSRNFRIFSLCINHEEIQSYYNQYDLNVFTILNISRYDVVSEMISVALCHYKSNKTLLKIELHGYFNNMLYSNLLQIRYIKK